MDFFSNYLDESVQLLAPVTIRLKSGKNPESVGEFCLAFSSSSSTEWACSEQEYGSVECEDGLLCGKTSHFTNYAFLLTGNEEEIEEELPSSGDSENIPVIISIVAVGIAVVLVSLGSIAVIIVRRKWEKEEKEDMGIK